MSHTDFMPETHTPSAIILYNLAHPYHYVICNTEEEASTLKGVRDLNQALETVPHGYKYIYKIQDEDLGTSVMQRIQRCYKWLGDHWKRC